jgi:hypothetical protein
VGEQAKFSITEAAKLAGLGRQSLYRNYINKRILSVVRGSSNVHIELIELLRVFPDLKLSDNQCGQLVTVGDSHRVEVEKREIELLREQLRQSNERERQAVEREEWLKSQIDELRNQ